MKLTFGKYKGLKLDNPEIPDPYICWLAKPKYSQGGSGAARMDVERGDVDT